MPNSTPWRQVVCAMLLTAVAAPAWAQQKSQDTSQQPMFKGDLTPANLFPRGKKVQPQAQMQPQMPAQLQGQKQVQNQPQDQARPAPFKKRFFDKLDTNFDGIVSREEFLAQANRQFNALDLNHDGKLSTDEISAAVAKAQPNQAQTQ